MDEWYLFQINWSDWTISILQFIFRGSRKIRVHKWILFEETIYIGGTFSLAKWFAKGVENVRNNSLVGLRHKRNGWPRHYQRVWGFQSIWIIANSTANALPELSFAICHPITRIQSNPLHPRITEIALPPIFDPFDFNIFLFHLS